MPRYYCECMYKPHWGDREGGHIIEIGYDTDKKEKFINHPDFHPVVYVGSEVSDKTDFYGNPVMEQPIKSLYEFNKAHENISNLYVAGDLKEDAQYRNKYYPEDITVYPTIPYCAYDIELLTSKKKADGTIDFVGFPDVRKADAPVTVITVYFSDSNSFKTFGWLPYTGENKDSYVQCGNEREMLTNFFSAIRPYVILTGWNTIGFDNIYLLSRCMNLGMETKNLFPIAVTDAEKLFKTRKVKMATGAKIEQESVKFSGYVNLDYKDVFSKFYPEKLESYTLENVARTMLGDGKLDYHSQVRSLDELYYTDYNTFVDYNIKDTLLIRDLENKLGYLKLTTMLAYMTKSNFTDVEYPTLIWMNYIDNELLKLGIIPKRNKYQESPAYLGGYVMPPIKGKHKWVAVFDVTSLYPSLYFRGGFSEMNIRTRSHDHDIRPSDNLKNDEHITELLSKDSDWFNSIRGNDSISIAGYHFKREHDILCRIVKTAFMKKDEYARLKKNAKNEEEENYYELMRYAIKIFINSFYGALAKSDFRYYCIESARSITETGQYLVRKVAQEVNKFLGYEAVVGMDTDSNFISLDPIVQKWKKKFEERNNKTPDKNDTIDFVNAFIEKNIQPKIDNVIKQIENDLGFVDPGMEMGREIICDNVLIKDKKRYMMAIAMDDKGKKYIEKPKLKIKGIEIVSTKTPKVLKEPMRNLCTTLLQTDTEKEFTAEYFEMLKNWNTMSIEAIALPSSVRGLREYKPTIAEGTNIVWKSGTPQHVKASLLYNHICKLLNMKRQLISDGMNIKYVFLNENNPYKCDVIGFINGDTFPHDFGLDQYIDRDRIWNKSTVNILDGLGTILKYKSLLADKLVEESLW